MAILLYFVAAILGFLNLFSYDQFVKVLRPFSQTGKLLCVTPEIHHRLIVYSVPVSLFLCIVGTGLLKYRLKLKLISKEVCLELCELWKVLVERLRAENRYALGILVIISLLGFGIRYYCLKYPMRCDETATYVYWSSGSFFGILSQYTEPNNHILHTLLQRVLLLIAGDSPTVLRLVAFVPGVLLIPLTYFASMAIYQSYFSALLASSFVATNSYLVEYSVNARGYSFVNFCFLICVLLAQFLKKNYNSTPVWILFTFISFFGFWAVPTMLFPYVALLIWLGMPFLFERKKHERWNFGKRILFSLLGTTLLTLGGYFIAWLFRPPKSAFNDPNVVRGGINLDQIKGTIEGLWAIHHRDFPFTIGCVFLAIFIYSILSDLRKEPKNRFSLGLSCILGILILVICQKKSPPYLRVLSYCIPVYFISIAYAIGKLKFTQKKIIWGSVVALTIVGIYRDIHQSEVLFFKPPFDSLTIQNPDEVVAFFKKNLKNEDCVTIFFPEEHILTYYFRRAHLIDSTIKSSSECFKSSRVWLVHNDLRYRNHEKVIGYDGFAFPKVVKEFSYTSIYLYEKLSARIH